MNSVLIGEFINRNIIISDPVGGNYCAEKIKYIQMLIIAYSNKIII